MLRAPAYHVSSDRQPPLPPVVQVRANDPSAFFVMRKWLPEPETASTLKMSPPSPAVATVI